MSGINQINKQINTNKNTKIKKNQSKPNMAANGGPTFFFIMNHHLHR